MHVPENTLRLWCKQIKPQKNNGSFFVHRCDKIVYMIYFKGHVNVTGLKNKLQIMDAISYLQSVPGILSVRLISVDNITCSGQLKSSLYSWDRKFALYLKQFHVGSGYIYKIQYSPQIFPGAFLKSENNGTIVFFATGKFNIVGCKSISAIIKTLKRFILAASKTKNGHSLRKIL